MLQNAKLSRLLVVACLSLAILLVDAVRPKIGYVNAAQSSRRELPLETKAKPNQAYGLYPAIVTSRPDPHMRVQVEVPSLGISGEWALPCVPVGSTGTPPLQSRVWVMFEQGDTHYPVWMGVPGN